MQGSHLPDDTRRRLGFLGARETAALARRGISVLDPHSTLVSPDVAFEGATTLWPNVVLQVLPGGALAVGTGTLLFPGTRMVAAGRIVVGADTEIGEEGGFTIKAEQGDGITIGDGARLLGGGSLTRSNRIGRGAQILGPIRAQNCRLGDGDTYKDPDPDLRGGVLKGSGIVRDLQVQQGYVIQAFGLFSEGVLRRQSYFHPKG